MRLTSDQVAAVKRLVDNPDFVKFMTALGDYHEVLVHQLISCPVDQLPVAQGRAHAILRVTTAVLDAKNLRPTHRT